MKKIVIAACAPRSSRRAAELFVDNRFKPRIVRNKKIYTRKNRVRANPEQ